jgi:G protein beta subunit-like protein
VAYEGHAGNVTAVGWQRDGRWLFSGSEDGSVRIWDPRASGSQRDYDARAAVHSVCLHPNQAELISADHSGTLRVWDLAAGKCAAELCPEVDSPLSSVGIAADASIVVAANFNGSVFCWRPRAGDEHEFVPLKRLNVRSAASKCARERERERESASERASATLALARAKRAVRARARATCYLE